LNRATNFFEDLLSKNEFAFIFWSTIIFYFFLFFNPNNKTLVISFFLYLGFLFFFTKDFKKSLLLAFLASWPILVGKTYEIKLITTQQLNMPSRPYGVNELIVISVREIFISLMFILLIREFILGKRKIFKFDIFAFSLGLFFVSLVIAAVFGSIRPNISLIFSLFYLEPIIFYFYLRNLIQEKKKILMPSLMVFAAVVIFEAILATLQFIKQGAVGLSLEISQKFLPLSLGVDEDISFLRPVATFYHANQLAQFILPYLFLLLPSLFLFFKKLNNLMLIAFMASFWVLLLSLGRSAWISFLVCFLAFLFILEKRWHLRLKIRKKVIRFLLLSLPFVLPVFFLYLMPRLINTFYAFQVYGGAYTRIILFKESFDIIKQFPFFGVGLGMDVFYSYQQSLFKATSIFSYLPEAVHNGYLHLLVQAGIFSLLIFLFTCSLFLRNLLRAIKNQPNLIIKALQLAVFLGLLAPFLNDLFQGYIPNLHEIIFFTIIYSSSNQLKDLI